MSQTSWTYFQARSDAEGRVQVPLTAGTWRIKTVLTVPAPEGTRVDWQSIWATLTFEVRQAPAGRIAVRQTVGRRAGRGEVETARPAHQEGRAP